MQEDLCNEEPVPVEEAGPGDEAVQAEEAPGRPGVAEEGLVFRLAASQVDFAREPFGDVAPSEHFVFQASRGFEIGAHNLLLVDVGVSLQEEEVLDPSPKFARAMEKGVELLRS